MSLSNEPLDPRLEKKLEAFKRVPSRDTRNAARGRMSFMSQAESLAQGVSSQQKKRPIRWIDPIIRLFGRKERTPMFVSLMSILLAVTLLTGGVTASAAQDSLPGQPLYEIKIISEDFRLELARTPQAEMSLNLAFARRRVSEMKRLVEAGRVPPEAILTRLQIELDQCLDLAAGLDDEGLTPALERIRQSLQTHDRLVQQAVPSVQEAPQAEASLERARTMIRERLKLVETGLQDPQTFRDRLHQHSSGPAAPSQTHQAGGNGPGPQQSGATAAGSSHGPGPHVTGTPTPGSGTGPGPGPERTAGSGYGTGLQATQPAGGSGPGPGASCTPDGGGGSGPGPGSQADCNCTPQPGSGQGPGHDSGPGGDHDSGGSGSGELGHPPNSGGDSGGHGGGGGGRP